ncbi:MAG: SCO family protein, partial [Alphaproteobacteria bacterium]|nr:SCO family protein [Alphaproteobacteria bacterium]
MAFIKRLKPKQFALWGGFVLIAILFAVWAVLFVLHFAPAQKTQHTTQTTQTKAQTITLAPKFSLTDENGQIVSETDYGASYKLIYFGFTYCPDVCPLQLQIISQALDRLGA